MFAFLPLSYLGIYNVASKVFSVLVDFTYPFSSALFPYYGSAYKQTRFGEFSHNEGFKILGHTLRTPSIRPLLYKQACHHPLRGAAIRGWIYSSLDIRTRI
jgi:uncharacterized membrane protein YbhN (UPF0104 family)